MNHSTPKPQTVMVDNTIYNQQYHEPLHHQTSNSIMNHSTTKPQTVMVDNTIYNQQHHEPLHHQTSNSNGGQYNI